MVLNQFPIWRSLVATSFHVQSAMILQPTNGTNQWHQPMPRSWPKNILASDEILRDLAAQMFPRGEPTRVGQVDFINR
jgi:hypothetical protein